MDYKETELQENELLSSVILPPAPGRSCGHYEKFARVEGDFATASVAVILSLNDASRVDQIRIAVGSSGATPITVQRLTATSWKISGGVNSKACIQGAGMDVFLGPFSFEVQEL